MAMPGHAEQCDEVIAAVDASEAVVLYDFPELFDPITQRIVDVLAEKRDVRLTSLYVQRSKDREDPANPRNYKRMVSIQYQESVHCLAFVLHVLGHACGSFDDVFSHGLTAAATAVRYTPPNPDAYPEPVDGRCDFTLQLGPVAVSGKTDFTRGASWAKTRIIEGTADGRPLRIEADYLEGRKRLVIDGQRARRRDANELLRRGAPHVRPLAPLGSPCRTHDRPLPAPALRQTGLSALGRALRGQPCGRPVALPTSVALDGFASRRLSQRLASMNACPTYAPVRPSPPG